MVYYWIQEKCHGLRPIVNEQQEYLKKFQVISLFRFGTSLNHFGASAN